MKRRVCETCFHFEAAGLNNSGWCRHPSRQFSSDVRLVVRGNEIGCRNGWNADLWVPAGIDPGSTASEDEDQQTASPGADQLTSIVPARYESMPENRDVGSAPEDVVVQHSPFQGYSAPEKDARDLVTNPRAAILRAREQFKVRQKREGRITDQPDRPILYVDATNDFPAPDDEPSRSDRGNEFADGSPENAPFLGGGATSAPPRVRNTVPPVTREEMRRPYPTITDFAEDATRFESVPAPQPTAPRMRQPPAQPIADFAPSPIAADDFGDDPFDDWLEDRLIAENGIQAPAPRPRRESIINRLLRERRERRTLELEDDELMMFEDFMPPMPDHPDQVTGVSDFEETNFASPPAARRRHHAIQANRHEITEPQRGSEDLAAFEMDADEPTYVPMDRYRNPDRDQIVPASTVIKTAQSSGAGRRQPTRDELPRWDEIDASFEEYAPVPPVAEGMPSLTAHLPRICRTCRDFRPADSGERGWCNNPWAFKHRRMVDADTLSCGSTFGTWWAAHDGVWQKSADVSRHAQETPLLDRLLGSKYDPRDTDLRRDAGRGQ